MNTALKLIGGQCDTELYTCFSHLSLEVYVCPCLVPIKVEVQHDPRRDRFLIFFVVFLGKELFVLLEEGVSDVQLEGAIRVALEESVDCCSLELPRGHSLLALLFDEVHHVCWECVLDTGILLPLALVATLLRLLLLLFRLCVLPGGSSILLLGLATVNTLLHLAHHVGDAATRRAFHPRSGGLLVSRHVTKAFRAVKSAVP